MTSSANHAAKELLSVEQQIVTLELKLEEQIKENAHLSKSLDYAENKLAFVTSVYNHLLDRILKKREEF